MTLRPTWRVGSDLRSADLRGGGFDVVVVPSDEFAAAVTELNHNHISFVVCAELPGAARLQTLARG
jgi:hypothetical protein